MTVERISFRGVESMPQIKSQETPMTKAPEKDEEKSNAAKYMIGATALAGVVALGVAGYKGKLGKGIQKFLGGAEKSVEKEGSKAAGAASGTAGEKIEKYTTQELEKLSSKQIKDLSPEEFEKALNTIFPDDEPVLAEVLGKLSKKIPQDEQTVTLGKFLHKFEVLHRYARMQVGTDGMKKLLGTNSPLYKKLNELKIGDIVDAIPDKFSNELAQNKLNFLKMFDKEKPLVDLIKSTGEEIPKELDFNKSLLEHLDLIVDMVS